MIDIMLLSGQSKKVEGEEQEQARGERRQSIQPVKFRESRFLGDGCVEWWWRGKRAFPLVLSC